MNGIGTFTNLRLSFWFRLVVGFGKHGLQY